MASTNKASEQGWLQCEWHQQHYCQLLTVKNVSHYSRIPTPCVASASLLFTDSALQRPHLLGGASDRADVRYNAACAAALAGQTAAAAALLQGLAAAKALDPADVAADEDLVGLRGEAWFVQLLQQLQPGQ
jgi:hypothetical protein